MLRATKKIASLASSSALNLLKVILIISNLSSEEYKVYALLVLCAGLVAALDNWAEIPRVNRKILSRIFINSTMETNILVLPLRQALAGLILFLMLAASIDPSLFISFVFDIIIFSPFVLLATKFSLLLPVIASKLEKNTSLLVFGIAKSTPTLMYLITYGSDISIRYVLILEAFGIFMGVVFYVLLEDISLKTCLKVLKRKIIFNKIKIPSKKVQLTSFKAVTAATCLGYIDNIFAITFLNPAQYKLFGAYLIAQSVGNQINYIYSLALASRIGYILESRTRTARVIFLSVSASLIGVVTVYFANSTLGVELNLILGSRLKSIEEISLTTLSVLVFYYAFDYIQAMLLIKHGFDYQYRLVVVQIILKSIILILLSIFWGLTPALIIYSSLFFAIIISLIGASLLLYEK